VAPTGSASGNGSAGQPWDLATALNQPAAVQPGDTIWLRGGTYSGAFTSYLAGTVVQPIIVRQYPVEHATVNGNLTVFGHDVWFWGFELVSPTASLGQVNGINSRAPRAKYINLVVHDASGTGIGFFDGADLTPAPDGEIYGSIIYNNGNLNNNDHGIYVDNNVGGKTVRDNVVFDNWCIGIQVYGTGPTQYVNNITVSGNIVFNNGTIGSSGGYDILMGGSNVPVRGGVVSGNYTYRNDRALTADIGFYFSSSNQDITLTNNYFVGTMELDDWASALVTGNTVYSTTPVSVYTSGQVINRGNVSGHVYSGNVFYGDATALRWGYKPTAGQGAVTPYPFVAWQAATGLTSAGVYAGSVPPNLVVVRPNVYELGRANIAVYNWTGQGTVAEDVAGVLTVGQTYRVMNVFNMYGAPVLSGTYTGGTLQLPMTASAAPAPLGRGTAGPSPGSTFNAFVLMTTP